MGDKSSFRFAALQQEIDTLDQSLDAILRSDDTFRTSLRTLSKLCGQSGLVPTSYRLSELVRVGEDPPCSGGFADVYRGSYDGRAVALKVIRLHVGDRAKYMKVFCQEAVIWKRLDHPHIVPFVGVESGNQACIVSEWMDHGDVMSYLERFPLANRKQLIMDIARGLEYMHASGLVHGDLKSRNVLVDSLGHARLSDFGLATTILGTASLATTAGSSANWGSLRYMAPELSDSMARDKTLNPKSDVYAFGMTAWEIFDGRIPFHEITNVYIVLREVLDGKRPLRPTHARDLGLDDYIWEVAIDSCWAADPLRRPQMLEVLEGLLAYDVARNLMSKLLDEGLSEEDRHTLDELLSTEMGRRAVCNAAYSDKLFEVLKGMRGRSEGMEGDSRKMRASDILLALGAFSSLPRDGRQYRDHALKVWLSYADERRPGIREAAERIMRIFSGRLYKTVGGHLSAVYSVSVSSDGSRIASGSAGNTIRLWNADIGWEACEPLQGHTGDVYSVSFSPDGRRLASASGDGTIRLWDVQTGQQVGEPLRGHTYWVRCLAFSPDGTRIVSGSSDDTLRLWDVQTGRVIGEPLRGHSNWVRTVAFSPDGKHIASGSSDKTIRLWDAETGKSVGEPLLGHDHWVRSVAYSPDGTRIVSGSQDKTIRVWDVQTRQTVLGPLREHEHEVFSVSFSPDGQHIVSGSYGGMIRIWDAHSGQTVAGPFVGSSNSVWSVVFSPDGKRVVSGGEDGLVKVWDAEND